MKHPTLTKTLEADSPRSIIDEIIVLGHIDDDTSSQLSQLASALSVLGDKYSFITDTNGTDGFAAAQAAAEKDDDKSQEQVDNIIQLSNRALDIEKLLTDKKSELLSALESGVSNAMLASVVEIEDDVEPKQDCLEVLRLLRITNNLVPSKDREALDVIIKNPEKGTKLIMASTNRVDTLLKSLLTKACPISEQIKFKKVPGFQILHSLLFGNDSSKTDGQYFTSLFASIIAPKGNSFLEKYQFAIGAIKKLMNSSKIDMDELTSNNGIGLLKLIVTSSMFVTAEQNHELRLVAHDYQKNVHDLNDPDPGALAKALDDHSEFLGLSNHESSYLAKLTSDFKSNDSTTSQGETKVDDPQDASMSTMMSTMMSALSALSSPIGSNTVNSNSNTTRAARLTHFNKTKAVYIKALRKFKGQGDTKIVAHGKASLARGSFGKVIPFTVYSQRQMGQQWPDDLKAPWYVNQHGNAVSSASKKGKEVALLKEVVKLRNHFAALGLDIEDFENEDDA